MRRHVASCGLIKAPLTASVAVRGSCTAVAPGSTLARRVGRSPEVAGSGSYDGKRAGRLGQCRRLVACHLAGYSSWFGLELAVGCRGVWLSSLRCQSTGQHGASRPSRELIHPERILRCWTSWRRCVSPVGQPPHRGIAAAEVRGSKRYAVPARVRSTNHRLRVVLLAVPPQEVGTRLTEAVLGKERPAPQRVELVQNANHIVGRHIRRSHKQRLDEQIDKIFWGTKQAS